MSSAWDELANHLADLHDIYGAAALLAWDQAVHMPPKGNAARSRAMATLDAEAHRRLVDSRVGKLIETLEDDSSLDEAQRASIRLLRRDYDRATKVPSELVKALAEACGIAYQAWTEARPASDWKTFEPHLEKIFSLKKRYADAVGWETERYDALVDDYEPAMTAAQIAPLFEELVGGLQPIVEAVLGAAGERPGFLAHAYDEDKQMSFCRDLVTQIGFDMEAGALERSPHPFTIHIGTNDVRQTTRTLAHNLPSSIYGAIHETGHALYDQGLPEELAGLPAGRSVSLGIHESQSRMWENQVGRGRAFSEWMLVSLKTIFPEELGKVDPDEFFRGVNHPERTLIRVEADELTYNLHVALRFEIELAIYRDELDIADLPDAWDQKMEKYVGIRPDSHRDGVLQDMHWAIGHHAYFPTYSLGTMYAAAFYAKAKQEIEDLEEGFRQGETRPLLDWLRANVHRHGSLYTATELGEKITGAPLSPQPLLDYLKEKFGALYDVSFA